MLFLSYVKEAYISFTNFLLESYKDNVDELLESMDKLSAITSIQSD